MNQKEQDLDMKIEALTATVLEIRYALQDLAAACGNDNRRIQRLEKDLEYLDGQLDHHRRIEHS